MTGFPGHWRGAVIGLARVLRPHLGDERMVVGLLLAFALSFRVAMALIVPPWQGPDEPKHFEYINVLVEKRAELWAERRMPTASDASPELQRQIFASMAEHHYWEYLGEQTPATLPTSFYEMWGPAGNALHSKSALTPLYYLLAAVVYFPFRGLGLEEQLLVIRFFSAVLSTATVAIVYLAGREVAPDDPFIRTVSAAFVAALPMHAFIGGVVNTDNLVTLLGSAVFLGLAIGYRRGFTVRRWAFVLIVLALALVTKRVAAGLLPAVLVVPLISLVSLRGRTLKLAGGGLVLALAVVGVVTATGLIQRVLPLGELRQIGVTYALNELGERQMDMLLHVPFRSPELWALIGGHLAWLFRGFWGVFGWFNLRLSPGLYGVLAAASLVCGVGFVVYLGRQIRLWVKDPSTVAGVEVRIGVISLIAIASMVALAVGERLGYLSSQQIPQGRYLFVVVAPIAVIYALGARTFLTRPLLGTWRAVGPVIIVLSALDLLVFAGYIVPFYVRR